MLSSLEKVSAQISDISIVFTLMEMPPLTEEEFQLQFSNLDQDKVSISFDLLLDLLLISIRSVKAKTFQDGLISFDDFKVYIMLNAAGGSNTASDQLTIEDITYMNQLYDSNKSLTVSQMKRVSNQQGKLEVFEKFFLGYEFETIDDMMFTERVERFENAIFGI